METKVMGVLQMAPYASATGASPAARAAVAAGRRLIAEGADIVEVVAAPTPDGCPTVHPIIEARRFRAVISPLMRDVRMAVRTGSPEVAAAAVGAGATIITDVSEPSAPAAGPGPLVALAADAGIGWVGVGGCAAGTPPSAAANGCASKTTGGPAEVFEALEARAEVAAAAGVEEIYVDPGIGLDRSVDDVLALLGRLDRLAAAGRPLVVGGDSDDDRLEGALTLAVWAMLQGASVIRTHHVAATVEAARTVGAKEPVGAP